VKLTHLFESAKFDLGLAPAADAAGRNGRWFKLSDAHGVFVFFIINQLNAATVACSIQQATSNAGAGAKAIQAVPVYVNQALGASDALTRGTDAASFTTDATLAEKVVGFYIPAAALDTNNGYAFIRAVTGASNVANITQACYLATGLDYSGQPLPSFRS
jgi:hypothetical protein